MRSKKIYFLFFFLIACGSNLSFAFAPDTVVTNQAKSQKFDPDKIKAIPTKTMERFDPSIWLSNSRLSQKSLNEKQFISDLNLATNAKKIEFRMKRVQKDPLGNTHLRLQQFIHGIKVYGGDVVVHFDKNGQYMGSGGKWLALYNGAIQPKVSIGKIKNQIKGKYSAWKKLDFEFEPELVLYQGRLAFTVYIKGQTGKPERQLQIIDAENGEIIHEENRILHLAPGPQGSHRFVTGNRLVDEDGSLMRFPSWKDTLGNYFLYHKNELWGVYDEDANDWGQRADSSWSTIDRSAISTANNIKTVQNYVRTVLLQNSYNNSGAFARCNIHVGTNYVNAYWDGSTFNFGDGDGVVANPLTTLDIVAHEYGHAITENTSDLIYSYESGALNESYSDIFGAVVEFFEQPDGRSAYPSGTNGRADWLMGEDSWLDGDALRDMRNPNRFGDPSYYRGTYWYTGSGDNGGVHTNSSVQNFVFYILSEGGTGINDGHPYTVTGIGVQAAAAIALYANMYLHSSSDNYQNAADHWAAAAEILGYSKNSVAQAWAAAGVRISEAYASLVTDTLDFGKVGLNESDTLKLQLYNGGNLTTVLRGLTWHRGGFFRLLDSLPQSISGGNTLSLRVLFPAQTLGSFADTLTIRTSSPTDSVLRAFVRGSVTPSNDINVFPYTIIDTLGSGDSIQRPLFIENRGAANLKYQFKSAPNGSLVINEFCNEPDFIEIRNFGSTINLAGYKLKWIDNVSTSDSITFTSATRILEGKFLSIREYTGSNNDSTYYYGKNIAWVEGSIVSISLISPSGQGIDFVRTTGSATLPPVGTSWSGTGVNFSSYTAYRSSNTDSNDPNNWSYSNSPSEYRLNPGQSSVVASNAGWLSVLPDSGIVDSSSIDTIQVSLRSLNKLAGTYRDTLKLIHNDRDTVSPLLIPVTMTVRDAQRLRLSSNRVDFDSCSTDNSKSFVLVLQNPGNQYTTIDSIRGLDLPFTRIGAVQIPPFDSIVWTISFNPTVLGLFQDTLHIYSNATDSSHQYVTLLGKGIQGPRMTILPDSLYYSLSPDDSSDTSNVKVKNSGGDLLNVKIQKVLYSDGPSFKTESFKNSAPNNTLITAANEIAHPFVNGELIIGLKNGKRSFQSPTYTSLIQSFESVKRARRNDVQISKGREILRVKLYTKDSLQTLEAISAFLKDSNVAYAQPNYIRTLKAIPNDPSFNLLYGLHNVGQSGGLTDADVDAPEAWDLSIGDTVVPIGIIDAGIDYRHPDLRDNIWTNRAESLGVAGVDDDRNGYIDDIHGYDFINNDSDPMDGHSHGTHVAGTVGAVGNNGIGVVGVNWKVKMAALKIFSDGGSTTDAAILNAIDYANTMGFRATNNSWGGGPFSQAMFDLIEEGGALGYLFIAAAGNDASSNDTYPHYPSNYTLSNVISVAATTDDNTLASFSNYGLVSVDLGAPGDQTYSTIPSSGYGYKSGTSMATPHVTGAAALLMNQRPTLSGLEIKEILMTSVDSITSLRGRVASHGKLNLYNALQKVKSKWLNVTPTNLITVRPGDSSYFQVSVNPEGLVAGRYLGKAILSSNDPYHLADTIKVELNVSSCKSLTMSLDSLKYGNIWIGQTDTLGVSFENSCNDTTTLTSANLPSGIVLGATMPFKIAPFKSLPVKVLYTPTSLGIKNDSIVFTSNADTLPNKTLFINALVLNPPAATVSPLAFHDTLFAAQQKSHLIRIRNSGGDTLKWALNNVGTSSTFVPSAVYTQDHYQEYSKEQPSELKGLPILTNKGGPDSAGYRWIDSGEPGGPAYVWTDIRTTGRLLSTVSGCDDCSELVNLGFPFNFYNTDYSSIYVSSNGYVTFGSGSSEYSNTPLPSTSMPRNLVAGHFDDLYPSGMGDIYFQEFSDRAIIQYTGVAYYSGSGSVTFQIVLYKNGQINFYYNSVTNSGISATAGIQNGTQTIGLTVGYNTSFIRSNLAVNISKAPRWYYVNQRSGIVLPGDSSQVQLTIKSNNLDYGVYQDSILWASNDPTLVGFSIPVRMDLVDCIGTRHIAFSDTSIYHRMMPTDTLKDTLVVYNQGSCPINIQTSLIDSGKVSFSGASKSLDLNKHEISPNALRKRVLLWTTYADMTWELPQTLAAINTYFTSYDTIMTRTTSASVLDSLLRTVDVFLLPEQESATGLGVIGTTFSSVLTQFVNRGGVVIGCGDYNGQMNQFMSSAGLINSTYYSSLSSGTLLVDTTKIITGGLSTTMIGPSITIGFTLANGTSAVSYSNYSVVAYRAIGSGYAVLIGFDYSTTNASASKIIANAVQLGSSASWIGAPNLTARIVPGDSLGLPLLWDARQKIAGRYKAILNVQHSASNRRTPYPISLSMDVDSLKVIQASSNRLQFSPTRIGEFQNKSFTLYNLGNASIRVDSIYSKSIHFSINKSLPLIISFKDSANIPVHFAPKNQGILFDTVTILSHADSGRVLKIALEGNGLPSPNINLDTNTWEFITAYGGSDTSSFNIVNNGQADLYWNIASEGQLRSRRLQVPIPGTQVRSYTATTMDLNCSYWTDAGNDAFDDFGNLTLNVGGVTSSVCLNADSVWYTINGYRVNVDYDFPDNHMLRIQLKPDSTQTQKRRIAISLSGGLGADGAGVGILDTIRIGGTSLPFYYVDANFPNYEPRVLVMVVPSNPKDVDSLRYRLSSGDYLYFNGGGIELPSTVYISPSYFPVDTLKNWLRRDLEIQGVEWLQVEKNTDTVRVGATGGVRGFARNVQYRPGLYRDSISIFHNDPDTLNPVKKKISLEVMPEIQFAKSNQTVLEKDTTLSIRLRLNTPGIKNVSGVLRITGSVQNNDYRMDTLRYTIPAGDTSTQVSLRILDDSRYEGQESLVLHLDSVSGAFAFSQNTQTIFITDSELPPRIEFTSSMQILDEGVGVARAIVRILDSTDLQGKYKLKISGTALYPLDHNLQSEWKFVSVGSTLDTVSFMVYNDTIDEIDEVILIELDSMENLRQGTGNQHRITLVDNDLPPKLKFVSKSKDVSEGDTVAILVGLSAPSSKSIQYSYSTMGSALFPEDHNLIGEFHTILPGQIADTIRFITYKSPTVELREYVDIYTHSLVNAFPTLDTTRIYINEIDTLYVGFADSSIIMREGDSIDVFVRMNPSAEFSITTKIDTRSGIDTSLWSVLSDSVVFNVGDTLQKIKVVSKLDHWYGKTQQGFLQLIAHPNIKLGPHIKTSFQTTNSEPAPVLTFSVLLDTVPDSYGIKKVVVSQDKRSIYRTVYQAKQAGSAVNPRDYQLTGDLAIDSGKWSDTLYVNIVDDTLGEANKLLKLILSNPVAGSIGIDSVYNLIITSDLVTLHLSHFGDGTVNPLDTVLTEGHTVSIKAIANPQVRFDKWTFISGSVRGLNLDSSINLITVYKSSSLRADFIGLGSLYISGVHDSAKIFINPTEAWDGVYMRTGPGLIAPLDADYYTVRVMDKNTRKQDYAVSILQGNPDTLKWMGYAPKPWSWKSLAQILDTNQIYHRNNVISPILQDLNADGLNDLRIVSEDGIGFDFLNTAGKFVFASSYSLPINGIQSVKKIYNPVLKKYDYVFALYSGAILKTNSKFQNLDTLILVDSMLTGLTIIKTNPDSIPDFMIGYKDGSMRILESVHSKNWTQRAVLNRDSTVLRIGVNVSPMVVDVTGDLLSDLLLLQENGTIDIYAQDSSGRYRYHSVLSEGGNLFEKPNNNIGYLDYDSLGLPTLFITDDKGFVYSLKAKLKGDVNDDGRVDLLDLQQLGIYWGKKSTDVTWKASVNIHCTKPNNRIQEINLLDLQVLSSQWGMTP